MKRIKVMFFIYQMGGGGAARTLLNIVNNIDRERFLPVLVTLNYNGSYETNLKEDVKFIKLNTKRLRSAILPLAKVIRKESPDIVFSTIPNYNTIAILATLLSFTRAKNIVREAAYLGGDFKTNLKLLVYGMFYKLTSQVIALSDGVKENIVKRYKVKPNKITVIYNPVDLENISRNINDGYIPEKHRLIFESPGKVIVTAGRLVKDKDHHTLLEAFAKARKQVNIKLVLLGEGELQEELKLKAKELQIIDQVYFVGFQLNPYIYFQKADLFVLSSIREGFGHVLAEALATGTPVISTRCEPGAGEVLNYGEFGRMCEVKDTDEMASLIIELLNLDENSREALITKGLQRADQFNAKLIVKQYEKVFNQTLDQTKNRQARGADEG
ncbi:glycosyltransferase [Virgibacillus halodenitrificans]|uniref:glycosyltransferase n=1 Tax=Virgibacillus halodenitrificans TaxID=1482 RepID=UPI00036E5702|nr:glycosyltransferase [Virgibacillus halodenitrificans]